MRSCAGRNLDRLQKAALFTTRLQVWSLASTAGRPDGAACGLVRRTPCSGRIYDALPPESRTARVRLLQPKAGARLSAARACVVHLAGTGDFAHERRLNLGFPLVAQVAPLAGAVCTLRERGPEGCMRAGP